MILDENPIDGFNNQLPQWQLTDSFFNRTNDPSLRLESNTILPLFTNRRGHWLFALSSMMILEEMKTLQGLWWLTLCQICTTNLNPSSFPGLPNWTIWLQWPIYSLLILDPLLLPPTSSNSPFSICSSSSSPDPDRAINKAWECRNSVIERGPYLTARPYLDRHPNTLI